MRPTFISRHARVAVIVAIVSVVSACSADRATSITPAPDTGVPQDANSIGGTWLLQPTNGTTMTMYLVEHGGDVSGSATWSDGKSAGSASVRGSVSTTSVELRVVTAESFVYRFVGAKPDRNVMAGTLTVGAAATPGVFQRAIGK